MRFRPTAPDSVLNSAKKEHRRVGRYALSVFADVPRVWDNGIAEEEQAVCRRLVRAAGLNSGIDLSGNPKYWVAPAASILDEGFLFIKDNDDDEIQEHYSVDLGSNAGLETVERFLKVFAGPRRVE